MPTVFPTTLDAFTNPSASDKVSIVSHSSQHGSLNDAVEALEEKVGIDSSAVATSLDYLIKNTSSKLGKIASLAVTDGNIIVGDGTNWVAESGATARISLGLAIGINVQAYNSNLTGINQALDTTASPTFAQLTLSSQSRISVYRNTDQTITHDTATKVQLASETYDALGEFDSTTNYRFTATTSGYYLVVGQIYYQSSVDQTSLQTRIYVDGAPVKYNLFNASGTAATSVAVTTILYLAANSYVELWAYQYSGGNITIGTGSGFTFLEIHRLS